METKPAPTRDGFGNELVEIGKANQDVICLSADLEDATRGEYFKFAYPDRFFNVGIAEQDLIGMAAGLSTLNYIPVICSFAVFMTNRGYDQLRLDLCYNNLNVKVVCTHAGVTVGEDGASAQCLEDLAIMRVLPNMIVIVPVDEPQARLATRAVVDYQGPTYMRCSRAAFPILTSPEDGFEIGKAQVMREGGDVTLIACGIHVSESLKAAETLAKDGIEAKVVNMHTIKPIDEQMIIDSANATGAIVTAEEHQKYGGLGSAVAEVLVKNSPVPLEMVAMEDAFGQTGNPRQLLEHYNLVDTDIVAAAKKAINRK